MGCNIFNSRAALYNVGLGKDERYLILKFACNFDYHFAMAVMHLLILPSQNGGGKY